MRVEIRCERAIFALLFLAAAIARVASEGGVGAVPPPIQSALPVEAPSSLLKAKLGQGPDDDAELLISGTWSATALSSLDLQAQPGGSLVPTLQPLLFTQTPDIALSFLLFKKIFVEARVSDDITQAKWSGGYRGGTGELLREAKIGNDGISFPSLPFLSFGEGSYRSLGASATIASDNFTGRAMVRYDQADQVVKHFVGGTEVTETSLSPNSFIAGKYLMTRGAPAANLAVYVQSSSGTLAGNDGNAYRQLGSDEYSYAAATGIVTLSTQAVTKVLAYYSGSGSGADSVTIPVVGACDLLYVPPPVPATGSLDPKLGLLNRYATTANPSSAEAFVRNPASGLRDLDYLARIDVGGFVEVTRVDAEDPSTAVPALRDSYRRPFESSAYANMPWLYTTDFASGIKVGSAPVYTREVVVQNFAASTVISIDRDFVPGSIQVTRNGIPDYSFSIDADTGVLTLLPPPSAAEDITITYMRESSERASGMLVGALGGFWDFGQAQQAWAALGATWSVPGSSYSTGLQTSPGSINLTAGEIKADSAFTHDAALAARYSQDDATGTYRLESMESNSGYSSDFMPASTALGYPTSVETADKALVLLFPSLVNSLHADGSLQQALEVIAGATVPGVGGEGIFSKVESAPPYSSFKTLSFFAKLSSSASLKLSLDDGAPTPTTSAQILLPAGTGNGTWRRYLLHYGRGDPKVYAQDSESAAEAVVPGASSTSPSVTSTGSRLSIDFIASQAGDQAWVDEVLLEDSVGSVALLFQGQAAYENPNLELDIGGVPILSRLKLSGDAQAAYDSSPYVSSGAEIDTNLLFARLGVKARATVANGSSPLFSGGHTIVLPATDFPIAVKDEFDYDPTSGAFGREDSLSIRGASIASLSAEQKAAWTPASGTLDLGMLLQSWDGQLTLGPSIATLGLSADNRSRPSAASATSGGPGAGYVSTWIGAFQYVLPAYESASELRDTKATLSIKNGAARELLSASVGESAQPSAAGGGTRNDTAQARIALPIMAAGLSVEPYYSRTWTDTRSDTASGIVDDAQATLRDFAALPVLYRGLPFSELGSAGTAADFNAQTAPSGIALATANFTPEAGLSLSREYGSSWYDFLAPAALTFSYGRALVRSADQATDAGVWSTTAKFASINLFGSMGAYPTRLPFDSDEYLSTLQAKLQVPRDGSASSLDLQFHGLATLYSGEFDKLDTDSKLSVAKAPGSLAWNGSLMLSLSRRVARHWLLDLYSLATRPGAAESPKDGKPNAASVASLYLSDLATRQPNVRSTVSITAGLSGYQSDAIAYQPGWAFEESYEAKLTVPERLTLKLDATLDQSLLASTHVLTLGFELGLTLAVSF